MEETNKVDDRQPRPKRKNGEGNISLRSDGRYMVRYSNPTTGKPIIAYCKTEDEAKIKLYDIKREVREAIYIAPTKLTVAQWIRKWLPRTRMDKGLKNNVYFRKRELFKTHIANSAFGRIPLQQLRRMNIEDFYCDLLESGKTRVVRDETGQKRVVVSGLANQTVKHIHNIVKPALASAVENGYIAKSPAEKLTGPKVERTRKPKVLSEDEVSKYLKQIQNRRLYGAFVLELGTGLRRGEILGLLWKDLDFETRVLSIRRQVQRVQNIDGPGSSLEYTATKTIAAERNILLPEVAFYELLAHKERQDAEKEAAGAKYQDEGLIFPTALGKKTDPRRLYEVHCRALQAAELPHRAFHDLRHTVATMLLWAGENIKSLQELLGHAKPSITLDTYTHTINEMKVANAERMNGIISNALPSVIPGSSPSIPE